MAERPISETIANVAFSEEIEITPEMVSAGVDLLVSYDPSREEEEDFVRRFLRGVLSPNPGITV